MTHRGRWSHYDDGIVSGRLQRALYTCDVCGRMTSCIWVDGYNLPDEVPWTATIIRNVHDERGKWRVAVSIGLGCGCLAKFHRQVAHIRDSIEEGRDFPQT